MRRPTTALALLPLAFMACTPAPAPADSAATANPAAANGSRGDNLGGIEATPANAAPFSVEVVADFDAPWAMTFLPDNRGLLVTEKSGRLLWWTDDHPVRQVRGVPGVSDAGQGGLGDVVLHPNFSANRMVYLSWAEEGPGGKGAAVGRGQLSADGLQLDNFQTIWRQEPFVSGNGHFGHRIAFGPDGMLYIASGERQQFDPAQNTRSNLGKILRLNDDGSTPPDNPLAAQATQLSSLTGPQEAAMRQIWSLGHRNPLGIAFDDAGRLWEMEMGPAGGDELNIVARGGNYGYPTVSNGDHYDGRTIPDHSPADGFVAPQLWWTPVISPGGMMIYRGNAFPAWRGDAFIAALSGQGLVRVDLDGASARHGDRWALGARIRAVAEGPDGAIWLLEDGRSGSQGRLLRLSPRR